MASKRRYFNEHIQSIALGMKDDFGDYLDNRINFSNECMAGMPEYTKYEDVPARRTGFNRAVPAAIEEVGPVMLDKGIIWRLK